MVSVCTLFTCPSLALHARTFLSIGQEQAGAQRGSVLVAHDRRIVVEAITTALSAQGYRVVGTAEDGWRAAVLASEQRPDIAVLGSALPTLSGLDASRRILGSAPSTGVLLLTGIGEDAVVQQALLQGVRGVVVDAQGLEDLLQAVHEVSQGAVYVSPLYSRTFLTAFAESPHHNGNDLTPREFAMLRLISEGKSNKQAAGVLGISVRTAECHRAHIMRKLDIHDTPGLVRYAIRQGLVVA